MLKGLSDLLGALFSPASGRESMDDTHTLQLAAAVLLVEVMRADASFDAGERRVLLAALRGKFQLTDEEAESLSAAAEQAAREATDLFAFTERINRHFDMPRKLRLVELMWSVAYADGEIDAHERHLMWRVGDLLHIPPAALQHARQRARGA